MKKILALVLVGAFTFSMPVLAANSPTASEVTNSYNTYNYYTTNNTYNTTTNNYNIRITVKGNAKKTPKVTINNSSSGTSSSTTVAEPPFINTVMKAPGLCDVIPVGQGGKLVICGVKTRATFVMRETTSAKVSSAKILAAQIGGSVKNVVETYAPGVRFSKAQVDFKVYGAHNGDVYKVYQLGANGTWNEVQVDEIREGHILVTVNKAGTFAFVKMN
ncbi:hypothetical protein [Butyrivibrio sp. WCD3002]|uniref:hypothetical protein n=1 Tax=Butyrivibrio sp. WCD3002 TaxID=1280676 RepID=UPI00047E3A65|nr:hypothetical protein [Butyrivibrio sp. WCD3002]